jgi:antitoxin HicB
MSWTYGARIETDETGDHFVLVRDLPEVQTSGDTVDEAIALAADAIKVAVSVRIDHEESLGPPSAVAPGEVAVTLPLRLAAKATVYVLWRDAKISKSELGRRMGRTETEARRILDPYHGTKFDQIEAAAEALGAKLAIDVVAAPSREQSAAAG